MRERLARWRGTVFRLRTRLLRPNVSVGAGLTLYHRLHIGGAGPVRIGRNCTVSGARGDGSQYACLDTYRPDASITIGDDVTLRAGRISATYEVTVGDGTVVEEAGVIDSDFHSLDRTRGDAPGESRDRCRIVVGRHVRLGARSYVMKGVTIGDGAVIAPGSIVLSPIRPGAVVAGNPAKPIG